ncbi:MAG TPA: ATP-binding cassette domain-containing protein [Polyangiaceae bacterium]|jgi:molybdate transport system ATP-binding protein
MTSEAGLSVRVTGQRRTARSHFAFDVALDFAVGLNVLFGPSGSGKTTILSTIAGLLRAESGRITLAGRVLFEHQTHVDLPPDHRRVALVFQSLALFPHLDASQNVEFGVPRSVARAERLERALGWLERMRVGHLARRFPISFSGGEAQRVALARALASEPRALLLDEPFSALDRELAQELSAELIEHIASAPIPVVLVTHDRALAHRLGERVTLLRAGKVERSGSAQELLPEVE